MGSVRFFAEQSNFQSVCTWRCHEWFQTYNPRQPAWQCATIASTTYQCTAMHHQCSHPISPVPCTLVPFTPPEAPEYVPSLHPQPPAAPEYVSSLHEQPPAAQGTWHVVVAAPAVLQPYSRPYSRTTAGRTSSSHDYEITPQTPSAAEFMTIAMACSSTAGTLSKWPQPARAGMAGW